MSSPPSDLSWMSSSDLDDLEMAVDVKEQSSIWQNSWTPINRPSQSVTAALSSLSSSQSDIDDDDDNDDDEPSPCASRFREAILSSALRMKQGRRGRKRKNPSTSPSSARKKRVVNASSKDNQNNAMLPDESTFPSGTASRAVEKAKRRPLESDDSLLPIRPTRLNIAASGHKRTSSEAFFGDTEDLPAKKTLVIRGVGDGTTSVSPFFMAREEQGRLMELLQPDSKFHFAAADASNKDNQEDLFNDDNTDIENFLEAEKALAATTAYPTPTSARSETSKPFRIMSSHGTGIATAPHKPPMKPFITPFLSPASPKVTSPTGPLATFSALHPLPIYFRIGEALRYVSSAFSSRPSTPVRAGTTFGTSNTMSLSLEIYAIVQTTHKNGASRTVTLADLFFPDRPPYLTGMITPQATSNATRSVFSPTLSPGTLVRVIAQISPRLVSNVSAAPGTTALIIVPSSSPGVNTPAGSAGKYDVSVLKIEPSDWDEIQRVKTILEGPSWTSVPAEGVSPVSTTRHIHKAEGAGRNIF